MKKIILSTLAVFFTASIFTSCIGDLDVTPRDPNVTQEFNQDGVFARLYASLVLTGLEGPAGQPDIASPDEGSTAFFRMLWNLQTLTTDEAICTWGDFGIQELNFNQWSAMIPQINFLFSRLYFNITLANHFLEQTDGMTDERTRRQRAEARFLRAMNWFFLMDLFGDVVFVDRVADRLPERIERADLFDYILSELALAYPDMYEPRRAPRYRVDQAAAWLLKSRVLLNAEVYTGTPRWTEAAQYARRVIDSAYELAPVFAHLFMADNDGSGTVNQANREIIFPIAHHGVHIRSFGGTLFLIASTHNTEMPDAGTTRAYWAGNRARQALVHKFFPNGEIPDAAFTNPERTLTAGIDQRAMFYIHRNVPGGNPDRSPETIENVEDFLEGFSVVKFTGLRADGAPTSDVEYVDTDLPFFRLAEAYLTFAEATLRAGGNAAEALTAVNALRTRAGAPVFTTLTLDMILEEKAREFFFEGQRRTDLIRFGRFGGSEQVWDWKGGVAQGTRIPAHLNVFPIPTGQLIANPNLEQNPGY